MPSKWDEIRKLVCNDSKKRLVQVKRKVKRDMEQGIGWTRNVWYEKDEYGGDGSFEDRWQKQMKKEYWGIQLEKTFALSNDGIGFYYSASIGLPIVAMAR